MIFKIKYFGMIAEAVGKDYEELTLELETVNEIQKHIKNLYPTLEDKSFKIAVNHSLVNDNFKLNNYDEVALLPPFAGG